MMNYILWITIIIGSFIPARGQATVGTILHEEASLQGYTFFSPFSGTKAYLVDNCGYLINEWDRGTPPGLSAYLLPNGLVFRTYKIDPLGPFTSASNAGGLELVDWQNNTVWSYEINTPTWLSHHDAVYLPNGNILALTWELVYEDELIDLGRDPDEIAPEGFMWSERIIEMEPVGTNEMIMVWEWNIKDHYIQDFDPNLPGFGVVAEHPELFNINLPELNNNNSNASRDWNHFNAIDYHPDLDQILISVRNSDEIWIIDHSTTTAEAASHAGGQWGRGGDLLYRWGNASAYQRGPVSEQRLFGQHGVNWITSGPTEDQGKIMLYNNGNGRPGPDFSTAEIIAPPTDKEGAYIQPEEAPFGPLSSNVLYGDQSGESFFSAYLSNAQRLPNGNTLINAGSPGLIFEVDPNRNKVWEYVIPLFGDFPATQGQGVANNANFRAYKFGPNYAGFDGLDLMPGNTIEQGESPVNCELFVGTDELDQLPLQIGTRYDQWEQTLYVSYPQELSLQIDLVNAVGQVFPLKSRLSQEQAFPLPTLASGVYFVRVITATGQVFAQQIFIFK